MKLSDSEWTVMSALWALASEDPGASDGVTARAVLERVEAETAWAYNTVKTILTRLVEKGALGESKLRGQSHYRATITRSEARRSALDSLVSRAFDGTFGSLMQHLVREQKLSRNEKRELGELLARLEDEERPAGEGGAR